MKQNIRIVLVCATILFATDAFAQNIHLGATTAVNATFVLDKGLSEDPRYNSEVTYKFAPIGFNFGIDIGRKFGLSLESILSKQGQIYKIIDAAEQIKGERKIDLSYLQLPMLMKFMSGGSGGARGNFNFGPQLSILRAATESLQAQAGSKFTIPDGVTKDAIRAEFGENVIFDTEEGTYTIQDDLNTDLLTKKANEFRNTEFALAASFGLDIDLSKHLYLTSQVRATYSLTDMRNGDVIDQIKQGGNIFANRANLIVGVQLGLHYSIGVTRSFKGRD